MKTPEKLFNLTFWLSIVFLFSSGITTHCQVLEMSAQDLIKQSTAVFYGKCTGKRCEWNENKSIIFTYVTIAPEGYIKGNLGTAPVIAVPGGQVGSIRYDVSDMPVFVEGEDLFAFVTTNASGKNLITGGFQGKMRIMKDQFTGKRMVEGISAMDAAEIQHQTFGQIRKARRMQLEDFIGKLKGYLKH